jgi:hypothetical protein
MFPARGMRLMAYRDEFRRGWRAAFSAAVRRRGEVIKGEICRKRVRISSAPLFADVRYGAEIRTARQILIMAVGQIGFV